MIAKGELSSYAAPAPKIIEHSINSTHEALRYQDSKSDKFWRIEYAYNSLAVNHGKTGTIGKYQVKDFATQADCEKEAKKLIASKIKKGYQPYPDFDPSRHFYLGGYDSYDIGLHPFTSHPNFRAHFTEGFYYDCADEAAPFGSDEGSDTLDMIEEILRKNKSLDFTAYPKKQIENNWGFNYIPPEDIPYETIEKLLDADEYSLTQSDMVTYITAFAQIKITGRIDTELKQMAIKAMKRKLVTDEIQGYDFAEETLQKMISDLEQFTNK